MAREIKEVMDWLITIARELGGTLTIEEALHVIIEHIKNIFPHQTLAVLVVDENTNKLNIKISRNISYSFVKQFKRDVNQHPAQQVLLKQDHLVYNNLKPEAPEYARLKLENDFTSVCLAPIIQNQRAVGYLHCDRNAPPLFTEEEARVLQAIALIGQQMEKFELLYLARHLALVDEASKALKYHAFLEQYHREVARARAYQTPLSLIFLAIDDYTNFVATCGIAAGHALLEEVHHLVKDCVRVIDIVGRFSADEFIVCLGGMNRADSAAMLEHIRVVIQQRAALSYGHPVSISGVAMTFEKREDFQVPLEKILSSLGSGLMAVRDMGRNHVMSIPPPHA